MPLVLKLAFLVLLSTIVGVGCVGIIQEDAKMHKPTVLGLSLHDLFVWTASICASLVLCLVYWILFPDHYFCC